ncbi:tetratricopeptide repeat protein [Deinococcus radiodurans]|nr:tetratricopeptide repeat protein [Deinococcus radiodurans]
MSDSVLRALTAALEADPADTGVREHLVRLLLDAGQGEQALALVRVWLAADPTRQVALGLAVRAADLAGDSQAAASYQTMLNALYQLEQGQSAPAPARQPVPTVSENGPHHATTLPNTGWTRTRRPPNSSRIPPAPTFPRAGSPSRATCR